MATWAIGDLQGCRDAFLRLLEAIAFDARQDRLWLTGDLVNRGPDSAGTLREVMRLGSAATTVLGNHDLHLLAVAMAPKAARRLKPGDTLADVLEAPDRAELLDWLLARPLLHRDRKLDWTLLHAGLPPQWNVDEAETEARATEAALRTHPEAFFAAMYGDQPDRWSPALAGMERRRFTVNCFTRLRYCTSEGTLLPRLKGPPETAPAEAFPWFSVPGRHSAGQRVVFGHWSALGLVRSPDALALDTGCVWGGRLTAVRLDDTDTKTPEDWQVVQVPAG